MTFLPYSLDKAIEDFANVGLKLLATEFAGARAPMPFVCNNGHLWQLSLNALKNGQRCRLCYDEHRGNSLRYSIDKAIKMFAQAGLECLETEYINSHTPMKYRCTCGNISYMQLVHIKRGTKCWECRGERIANSKRRSIEVVKEIFREDGCELLTDNYKNSHQKLTYKCKAGHITTTNLNHFLNGNRCKKCATLASPVSKYGKEHPKWKHGLCNTHRYRYRLVEGYGKWRIKVLRRDNFTCKRCGKTRHETKVQTHHIVGYASNEGLRIDIDNGATLCDKCHTFYHKTFGNLDNTMEQFNYFISNL